MMMIISFVLGTEVIEAMVDSDRNLFLRARGTNNSWVSLGDLSEKTGQSDKRAALITERTIKSKEVLPTPEDVEFYIIDEFSRTPGLKGLRHVKTVW